jgi:phosphatidate cytidylyltransferase
MRADPLAGNDDPDNGKRITKDLRPRIVSGLVLAAVALALTYAGPHPFALLVLVIAVLMSWEWGRVVRGTELDVTFVVHALATTMAALLAAMGYAALGVAAVIIGAIIVIPLQFGEKVWHSAQGVLYTGLPVVSLLWLRGDEPYGLRAVLFIFVIVWTTDTAAYVSGQLFKGPKLWPSVSPNKTWSGLVGGIVGSVIAGVLFAEVVGAPPAWLAAAGFALGLVAQAGDLAESALKRGFGVKDSSNLIPGHGGFMDRMDSIVAAAVAAAAFTLFIDAHAPAAALLFGS